MHTKGAVLTPQVQIIASLGADIVLDQTKVEQRLSTFTQRGGAGECNAVGGWSLKKSTRNVVAQLQAGAHVSAIFHITARRACLSSYSAEFRQLRCQDVHASKHLYLNADIQASAENNLLLRWTGQPTGLRLLQRHDFQDLQTRTTFEQARESIY